MILFIFFLTLAVIFNENIKCYCIEIGNYPLPGVNTDTCGLRYEPTVHNLMFRKKCFKNTYANRTYFDAQGMLFEVGPGHVNSRVEHGRIAYFGEAPWTVQISFRTPWKPFSETAICTGVLITFQWVLTSAHCHDDTQLVLIYTGQVNKEFGPHARADQWFIHPEYDESKWGFRAHDLALIKLNKTFPQNFINEYNFFIINVICLPKESFEMNENTEWQTYFGYGSFNGSRSEYLRRMSVRISPFPDYCHQLFGLVICSNVTESGEKACYGDSGGGLVDRQGPDWNRSILTGIISGVSPVSIGEGHPNCSISRMNMFSPVSRHIQWILETINNNTLVED